MPSPLCKERYNPGIGKLGCRGGGVVRVQSSVTVLVNLKLRGLGDVEAKDILESIGPYTLSNNHGPISKGSTALPACPLSAACTFYILF